MAARKKNTADSKVNATTEVLTEAEVVVDTTETVGITAEPVAAIVVDEDVNAETVVAEEPTVEVIETPVSNEILSGLFIEIYRAKDPQVKRRLERIDANIEIKDGKYVGPFESRGALGKIRMVIAAAGIKTNIVEL